jgi:tRNA(fMet)-specific endonuclease VapC
MQLPLICCNNRWESSHMPSGSAIFHPSRVPGAQTKHLSLRKIRLFLKKWTPSFGDEMKVCLDTNAYTKLILGHAPLQKLVEFADDVIIPATVLGELRAGFEMGSRTAENVQRLREFLALPGVTVAETTEDIAERYGMLVAQLRRSGTPLPTNDIWIASTAMESGARLVTYDQHFDSVAGLLVLAP